MATELRLPQITMGMQEATVTRWLKAVGDEVAADEPVVEVEAEKSEVEVVAPVAGVLARIVAEPGTVVEARGALAIITDPGEELPEAPEPAATAAAPPTSTPTRTPTGAEPPAPEGRAQVTPAARKRAKELGVDLASVTGTGPGGRITDADVEAVAGAHGGGRRVPLRGLRGTIASRMVTSLQTMAQLTLSTEVDVTELVEHRKRQADPVGLNDLVLRAAVIALGSHPALNSSVDGDHIVEHDHVHLGVAVARPDGLLVAVVAEAEAMDLATLSPAVAEVVGRVKAGTHAVADVTGSTFTVTNLGPFGIDAFTPIVNPPEVAILGVGRTVERPVRGATHGIEWRTLITLSLTIDHRVVDGVPGAEFLTTLGRVLNEPATLEAPPSASTA